MLLLVSGRMSAKLTSVSLSSERPFHAKTILYNDENSRQINSRPSSSQVIGILLSLHGVVYFVLRMVTSGGLSVGRVLASVSL